MGTAELAFYNSLWEQAASEGMSVLVASGDAGAAGCYEGSAAAGSGTAVNGLCTSPYATCVGGTEFDEGSNPAQYWASTNAPNYGTALGYIPEEVWNESAADGGDGITKLIGELDSEMTEAADSLDRGLERERAKWGIGAVGLGGRGKHDLRAAAVADGVERSERGQWNAGGAGYLRGGSGARWICHL